MTGPLLHLVVALVLLAIMVALALEAAAAFASKLAGVL